MDVLPAQASSVSSERVFSSSKLTCTRARNKISASTIESLQILKYSLRNIRKDPQTAIEKDTGDDIDPSCALDFMSRLGDSDWSHDAILDVDI